MPVPEILMKYSILISSLYYVITLAKPSFRHKFININFISKKCPGTSDRNSDLRIFGKAVGYEYFDNERGAFRMRRQGRFQGLI